MGKPLPILVAIALLAPATSVLAQDSWSPIANAGAPQGSEQATAIWTGEEMIVWGGNGSGGAPTNLGLRYSPSADAWSSISTTGAPQGRFGHTGVWTGRELIVWGGIIDNSNTLTNDGARYDPRTYSWSPVSLTGAPSARCLHTAVWTGKEMIVWGGSDSAGVWLSTGARYDPQSNTWSPITAMGGPSARSLHIAVWTGREMLVWGGAPTGSGARYDPSADTWSAISSTNEPISRTEPSAVWTGRELIVWGGSTGIPAIGYVNSGGRYDPVSDTWSQTSTAQAPSARVSQSAVWTGREMIVWGGLQESSPYALDTGARYDPLADAWSALPAAGRPGMRAYHVAVWTGRDMLVFGGADYATSNSLSTGGSYRPPVSPRDTWSATSLAGAPEGRSSHAAVWTGREMIVWGGAGTTSNPQLGYRLDSGGRYDFVTRSWMPTAVNGAPTPRLEPTAVWTGREMIVWGADGNLPAGAGGRYNPTTDSWVLMSQSGEPSARINHTAVWTGKELIIWGGSLVAGGAAGDGARYDPGTNTWSSLSATGAPSARYLHSAVWTGREMIIWGGLVPNPPGNAIPQNTGARYDPRTDTWASLATSGSPSARGNHTAVWTGSEMVVWGGDEQTNTGGRYSPVTDSWTATATLNAPAGRTSHSAIWTGNEMIVWGGQGAAMLGGRYSVADDAWLQTTDSGAPTARGDHTMVWTGRHMTVWGGNDGGPGLGNTDTGGAYGDDPSPPVPGSVSDGLGPDLVVQLDTTTISANWSGFSDPESGIAKYEWAIGSSPGGIDVQPFVDIGSATSATASGLLLQVGRTCYVTVRATNSEGLVVTASSDGVSIGDSRTAKSGCAAGVVERQPVSAVALVVVVSVLMTLRRFRLRRSLR